VNDFALASRCPRLARARDGYIAEQARIAASERRSRNERLRLSRLVAHRELQLQRAFWTGSPRYIAVRQRKLQEAQKRLARWTA
jgi:hypothetical protein